MNKYNITKNFNFLENTSFLSGKKEEVLKSIEEIERLENFEECIRKIEEVLGIMLDAYVSNKNPTAKFYTDFISYNLNEKIQSLKDVYGSGFSLGLLATMHAIGTHRNAKLLNGDKKTNSEISILDVLSGLKNLYVIITNLFDTDSGVHNSFLFDHEIYKNFTSFSDTKVSAVSNQTENYSGEITQDLCIDGSPIRVWLTLNAKIVIPIYQRRYEWKIQQIDILFDDILKTVKQNSSHYFGTIASKLIQKSSPYGCDQVKIIDGQQRITTSLLLLAAAREVFKSKFNIDINEEKSLLDVCKNISPKYVHNPGGDDIANTTFREILDGTFNRNKTNYENNFRTNYLRMCERMTNELKSVDELRNFVLIFIEKFKVSSISFDTKIHSNKSEMEIFENLNSKGLDLGITDLIKNHIFNLCSDSLLNNKESDIPKLYLALLTDNELLKNSSKLEEFYVSLSQMASGKDLSKDKNARFIEISNSINSILESETNNREITDIKQFERTINKLGSYMKVYAEILEIIRSNYFVESTGIEAMLSLIKNPKKKKIFCYFAYLLKDVIERKYKCETSFNAFSGIKLSKSDVGSIQKLFLEISKYIIRTQIITKQGDSNIIREIFRICNELLKEINNFNDVDDYCVSAIKLINELYKEDIYSYEKFKTALYSNRDENAIASLLVLTENIMSDSLFGKNEYIGRKTTTVEHVMPQEPSKWINEIISDDDKVIFKENHNQYLNKIGNYLILTSSKNSQAKNLTFREKKQNTYKSLNSPLYKSIDYDIDISNKEIWNFDNIDKRTDSLIRFILTYVIIK